METAIILNADKEVTVTLHRSDFNETNWNYFHVNTDWFHVMFSGLNIIRIFTWESSYPTIQEMYNFNNHV